MAASYKILDSGNLSKLEELGTFRFVRPCPQAVWRPKLPESDWDNWDARFDRFSGGNGRWEIRNPELKRPLVLEYQGIKLVVKLTDFGHLGVFPEHLLRHQELLGWIRDFEGDNPPRVLNLFAYTGSASLACARYGAEVVHVDSSKTSVAWAKENHQYNDEIPDRIRWIVDDVRKFVLRERRRAQRYQGVILDPPSFGRGSQAQVWKIEEHLLPLLEDLSGILADDFMFVFLSCHSHGFSAETLRHLLCDMGAPQPWQIESGEMLIPASYGRNLPSGSFALLHRPAGLLP